MTDDDADKNAKKARSDQADLSVGGRSAWARAPLGPVSPRTQSVAIQTVEADYTIERFQGQERAAIVRFFGITMEGNSVLVNIHGFTSYFYVPTFDGFNQNDLTLFADSLNNALAEQSREKGLTRYVKGVVMCSKKSLWGYQFGKHHPFIQVSVTIPSLVATSRRILEQGIMMGQHGRKMFQTYESNIAYVLRFMVDKDIRGGAWIEMPKGTYNVRSTAQKVSHCQLEIDVMDWKTVVAHPPEGEWLKMAPLRVLSFDIECAGRKGFFPTAAVDPVIQIANVLTVPGAKKPIAQNVFTLNTCASIVDCQVISHQTEQELLMKWMEFFVYADPDLITGYAHTQTHTHTHTHTHTTHTPKDAADRARGGSCRVGLLCPVGGTRAVRSAHRGRRGC